MLIFVICWCEILFKMTIRDNLIFDIDINDPSLKNK